MRKFKVGDSVVIKQVQPLDEIFGIRKGDTGIIIELDHTRYNSYIVKADRLPYSVPMIESQMEHLAIDSLPSPDNPQEIKFPSIEEAYLSNCLSGYIEVNSNDIKINSDSFNINTEKEKNNMEILDLYVERKKFKVNNDFLVNKNKILEEDEIQKIFKEMIEQVNVILENEGSQPVEYLPVQYKEKFYTAKTKEKLKKLEIDTDMLKDELTLNCKEVEAMLSMTDNYEEQIKILKNYGIIDKKTNKLNV